MDKVLIALGAYLVWLAANDRAGDAVQAGDTLVKADGFLGMLVIFAILLSFAQYAKGYEWVASSLAAIIALGFWANK